jgi:HAD superfamily hydrolase (TIGR01509 family)
MSTVRGVLFDVGGVLVDLDGVPSLAALLGAEAHHADMHRRWMACPSVILHETGRISTEAFAAQLTVELGLTLSPEAFLLEFDGWLRRPLPGAFELVAAIPVTYQVGILSNMSAFHWRRIIAMGLPDRIDTICVSHEIGFLKPSREAFDTALDRMALAPRDVLFLDDGTANVDAARAMGLTAHVVRGPGEARTVLESYGVVQCTRPGRHGSKGTERC